jgi:restriction endonuclease Mrr
MLNSLKCVSAFRKIRPSRKETFALDERKLKKVSCVAKNKLKKSRIELDTGNIGISGICKLRNWLNNVI